MSKKRRPYKPQTARKSSPLVQGIKPVEGKTVLDRFLATAKEYGENFSRRTIIQFFSLENARALCFGSATDGYPESLMKECYDLLQYFTEHYADDKKLLRLMMENWGQLPLVLRIGMAHADELAADDSGEEDNDENYYGEDEFPFDREYPLTEEQTRMCRVLVEYVFSKNTQCDISCFIDAYADDGSRLGIINFPKDIPSEDVLDAREEAESWFSSLLVRGGGIIIRFKGVGKKGKDIVNGVRFENGSMEALPRKHLEMACSMTPDGRMERDSTADYRMPDWNL